MPSALMRDSIRTLVQVTAIKIWMSEASRVQEHKSNAENYRCSNDPVSSQTLAITYSVIRN